MRYVLYLAAIIAFVIGCAFFVGTLGSAAYGVLAELSKLYDLGMAPPNDPAIFFGRALWFLKYVGMCTGVGTALFIILLAYELLADKQPRHASRA